MKSYSSYKDSGVKWIGEIPSHWDVCKMKHCGELICGGTPSTNRDDYWGGDIPWIQSGKVHFKKITIDDVDKFITELGFRESSTKMVRKDSPVIAITGATCSNVGFLTFDSTVNQSIIGIQVNEVNTSYYIYYYMISQKNQILYHQSGGAQGGVTKGDVENLNIPKISYREQTQIVSFLDTKTQKIDELIEKTEQKIKLLKEKRTSLINHCLTKGLNPNVEMKDSGVEWIGEIPRDWGFVKVGHYTNVVRGGSPRPSGDKRYFNGDFIPWITVKDISNPKGKYVYKTESFLTEEGMKQSRVLEPETLVLTNSGVTLGIPKILKIKGCINDGSVGFLDISEKLYRDFLYYFFTTQTKLLLEQQSGYGQPNLNIEIVSNIKFPLPTFHEQNQIVEYLDEQTQKIDSTIEKETQ